MDIINFLIKIVITALFLTTSMMIIKWKKLTKDNKESRLYSRMSFGLLIIGIYTLLSSLEALTIIPTSINPLNKVIELVGLLVIMFGFLDFLEVSKRR